MTKMFKPMLAKEVDFDLLDFENNQYSVSAKLDGIRAIIINGQVMSRSLKPIPNKHVQMLFGRREFEGFDGELLVGSYTDPHVYAKTNSGVMSIEGEPAVHFVVFDHIGEPELPWSERVRKVLDASALPANVVPWRGEVVESLEALRALEAAKLEEGYEGLMIRKVDMPYKFGRSTANQQHLLKMKTFEDGEAVVVGFQELMHNANEAETNELGRTKRSSKAEGLVPMGTLGALIVKDLVTDVEFNIGTGFTSAQRQEIWDHREEILGKIAKYKHFPIGQVDKPRHPVFQGWRDPIDL